LSVEKRIDCVVAACQCCAVERGTPITCSRAPDARSSGEEEMDKVEAAVHASNLAGEERDGD
jgi:hypothetical protein